jgi:hypothetical protein
MHLVHPFGNISRWISSPSMTDYHRNGLSVDAVSWSMLRSPRNGRMKSTDFETIVTLLNRHEVRYLVAGGMAVVAHGYGRLTVDLDLIVQLEPQNVVRAFAALAELGYQPRVPVKAEQFADQATREGWIRDKGMLVLNLFSDAHRRTPIDVFVREPFPFDGMWASGVRETIGNQTFRVVDIPTLIRMKKEVARPKDLDDIEHLEKLLHD